MIQCDKSAVQQFRQVVLWLLLLGVALLPSVRAEGIITTVAGKCGMSSNYSGDGGLATAAGMSPNGIIIDGIGNLYISDDHRIRKVDTNGIITTIAGSDTAGYSGDGGPATSAQFYFPSKITFDNLGILYITDSYNHRVRKIDTNGIVTTIAGNGGEGCSGDGELALEAQFLKPTSIVIDNDGNLYISETGCNRIRKIDTHSVVTTIAGGNYWADYETHGDGKPAVEASLNWPIGITIDSAGNLYIADSLNNVIRKVDTSGIITTVVGDTTNSSLSGGFSGDGDVATNARLRDPTDVVADNAGNLYIADYGNNRIRKVDTKGIITTVAGTGIGKYTYGGENGDGGPATASNLYNPADIALDKIGNLYIVESTNNCIRKVTFTAENPPTTALPVLGKNDTVQFTGGVGINGQAHQRTATLKLSDTVDVTGNITVDPADVDKNADIFVYAEATLPSSPETVYFMLGEGLTISLWDKNPNNLVAFQPNVTLGATQSVSMYSGNFVYPGTLKIYFGYRLANGTLVTNPEPIRITISNKGEPQFRGLVQVTSTDTDRVTLAWLPATDDNTPSEAITYQVHLSDQANFAPSNATLQTAVTGQQQTEVSGLATGHTYNVLVVAVDQEGNESVERDYRTTTTFSEPVIVSQTTQFAEDKNLGLGEATTADGVQFSYPSGSTLPQVGSVLFANVGEDMYLRKVDSVTPTAGGVTVQTSDAELADVIEQGTIDSEMTLFDVEEESIRSGIRNGRDRAVMRWQDNLLVAEQENFDQNGATVRSTRDVKEQVSVSASVAFEPSAKIKLVWGRVPGQGIFLARGEVTARGQFSADVNAFYDFKASGSAKKKFTLFKRVYFSSYLVGTVPVFQRNTLTVTAELSANAASEVKANAGASATAAIEMGARYNPSTGAWDPIPLTPSFEKSFKAGLDVKGNVHGEVRLIPNLQVEFYGTAASDLSIEPFITGDVAIASIPKGELLAEFGYLPVQLTQFDVNLQAQAFMGVSVKFLSKKFSVLNKTQVWQSPQWLLFSLPELSVSDGSGKVNEPITLTATTEDGTNNPFKEGSVKWFVSPNKGTISGGKTGTFTSGEEGSYTVFFSGHGYFGDPLGRQFTSAKVSVGGCGDNKPVASFIVTPSSGTAPLTITLDASGSYTPTGSLVNYLWSSSDGQTAMGSSASMTFNSAGTYTVSLTVEDEKGCKGTSVSQDITVSEGNNLQSSYVGCYKDDTKRDGTALGPLAPRDLSGKVWLDEKRNQMTIEKCLAFCKGFAYAGLQASSVCFCGNSYGKYGEANNCSSSCSGNSSQICGGIWANSVYKVPK